MKKVLCFALIVIVMCNISISAHAAIQDEIMPRYDKISTISANLTINENTGIATCTGKITAKNTYDVSVLMTLEIKENGNWRVLRSWSSSGVLSATASHYYAVYSGYEYRVGVTGYVLDSNGNYIESGYVEKTLYYPAN